MTRNFYEYKAGTLPLLAIALVCLCCSCKQGANEATTTIQKQENVSQPSGDVTRAILKVQPFDFDKDNSKKVTGAYKDITNLSVPKDLAGQNKWIMFEGPVLENDRVAYRYYADSRHRFDIYGKKVSDLVMDTVSWNYHDIMDWGSDILKVGSSLGLGSPAIHYKGELYPLEKWESKEIRVTSDGGERSSIETTFKSLQIADQKLDVIESWSISEGNLHSEITLRSVGALPSGMKFATGIVKHLETANYEDKNGVAILSSWGNQSFHKQDLGMAILAKSAYAPKVMEDPSSHLLVFENSDNGVSYSFLADWSQSIGGSKSQDDFNKQLVLATENILRMD